MARITKELHELREADVQFISLVRRAANRIPFRVLKQDEGETMDLTKIFSRKSEQAPEVVAVVVAEPQDAVTAEAVRKVLKDSGLNIDKVTKQENTVVFNQKDNPKDYKLIRLSDNLVVAVSGIESVSSETYPDMVTSEGFFHNYDVAFDVVKKSVGDILANFENRDEVGKLVETEIANLAAYVGALSKVVPDKVVKADADIRVLLQKSAMIKCPQCGDSVPAGTTKCPKCGATIASAKKEEQPAEAVEKEEKPSGTSAVEQKEPASEGTPKGADPTTDPAQQKPQQDSDAAKESIVKAEQMATQVSQEVNSLKDSIQKSEKDLGDKVTALTNSMQSIADSLKSLTTKLDGIEETQGKQKEIVDVLVSKSDTLDEKLSGTIAAVPRSLDVVGRSHQPSRAVKQDEEDEFPEGNIDTAFIARSRRGRR
jgi:hypothetical protein